jgi:hypothetical protein
MRTNLAILYLSWVFVMGCDSLGSINSLFGTETHAALDSDFIDYLEILSSDPNDDGMITAGESTYPEPTCQVKPSYCTLGVRIEMRICLVEQANGETFYVLDANRNLVCAYWSMYAECTENRFVLQAAECLAGPDEYCEMTVNEGAPVVLCGWKVDYVSVTNDEGTVLERFEASDLEKVIDIEMLPMGDSGQ